MTWSREQDRGQRAAGVALVVLGAWLLPRLSRARRTVAAPSAPPFASPSRAPLAPPPGGWRAGAAPPAQAPAQPQEVPGEAPATVEVSGQDLWTRLAGVALVLSIAWFLPWLFGHLDLVKPWIAIPFALATVLVAASSLLSVLNRWQRAVPARVPVPRGAEPTVAVIVPTLGEPPQLLEETVRSVLDQDWPTHRLWLMVSDDAGDARVREMVQRLAHEYPQASVGYHTPPGREDPRRRGEAKAGNLNSAVMLVPPEIRYIESRDADDLVGDPRFLRETVGQLLADERLAFVQTTKGGAVSRRDPFDNRQPHFFRCAMLSRHAANAVFPCGSGLVWRRAALAEIGYFPTWNLVEDLQSGVEALRRGWNSCYLPILGAYAQHSPEDLPNFIKQRGTWALDTVRLVLWAPKRGLGLRQRLQFYELGLFYLQGLATIIFLVVPILGFTFRAYPVVTSTEAFVIHLWPFIVALELFLALTHRQLSLEELWRARLTWVGLSVVYARACVLAVLGGPWRKPRYVVTRKENQFAWHWRDVLPHAMLLGLLLGSMAWSLAHRSLFGSFDVGSAYWAILYSLLLAGFIRLSWFGVSTPLPRRASNRAAGHARAGRRVRAVQAAPSAADLLLRSLGAPPASPHPVRAHVAASRASQSTRRGALPRHAPRGPRSTLHGAPPPWPSGVERSLPDGRPAGDEAVEVLLGERHGRAE